MGGGNWEYLEIAYNKILFVWKVLIFLISDFMFD